MTALVRGISDLGVPARRGITLLSDIPDRQCPPSRPPTPSQVKQAEGQAAGEPEGFRPASIWQKNGCGPAQSCCRQWARSRATTVTMTRDRTSARYPGAGRERAGATRRAEGSGGGPIRAGWRRSPPAIPRRVPDALPCRRALRTAAGEPLHSADSVRPFTSAVHLPVRPWLPRSQGFPRESDAVPMAAPRRPAATSGVGPRRRRTTRAEVPLAGLSLTMRRRWRRRSRRRAVSSSRSTCSAVPVASRKVRLPARAGRSRSSKCHSEACNKPL